VTAPYNGSGFAYAATATTSSQVASASIGDSATTTYSVRYMVNIAPSTIPATYTANIIYTATANF
jgi:TPP-dependent pyruvate/acetoin dehydrogenase alpha subunit